MKRGFGPLKFRTKFFLSSFFATVVLPLFGVWLLYNQDIESTKELIYSNLKNQTNNLSESIYPAIAFDDKCPVNRNITAESFNFLSNWMGNLIRSKIMNNISLLDIICTFELYCPA